MDETLHYLLMSGHLLFKKALFTAIKDTDLTLGQPKVLDYLRLYDGAVQKDIAAACHIEPASLTNILAGMEAKGLIVRKTQNDNRRFVYVFMTDKGRGLMQRVKDEFDILEQQAFEGFTPEEKEAVSKYLIRVYNNMKIIVDE